MRSAKTIVFIFLFILSTITAQTKVQTGSPEMQIKNIEADVTTFPYSEGWETSITWTQSQSDVQDWIRGSGSTPTIATGPTSANEGTYYLYFEGTTSLGANAILESPTFDFSTLSNPVLSFDYHMYLNYYTDGTFNIDISTNSGLNWTNIWTRIGHQGTFWFNDEEIDLTTYAGETSVQFRFEFVRGNESAGYYDCAFDDVKVYDSAPTPVELVSFTYIFKQSTKKGISVLLNWETATEINNYGFEVQRSAFSSQISEKEWEALGFIEGHGNSNSPKYYEFIDDNPLTDTAEYRLKQIDTDGGFEYYAETVQVAPYSTTDVNDIALPQNYNLVQNYPNPFNPSTKINFSLPNKAQVKLEVYNSLGQEVATLINKEMSAGYHSAIFDASHLSSGLYFYRINVGGSEQDFVDVKKMLLVK